MITDIIIGTMLGDSKMEFSNVGTARYIYELSIKHKEYLDFVFCLFKDFTVNEPKEYKHYDKRTEKSTVSYRGNYCSPNPSEASDWVSNNYRYPSHTRRTFPVILTRDLSLCSRVKIHLVRLLRLCSIPLLRCFILESLIVDVLLKYYHL